PALAAKTGIVHEKTSIRCRKERFHWRPRREPLIKSALPRFRARLARATQDPLPTPPGGRSRGSFAATPKIQERSPKPSPRIRVLRSPGLSPVADLPSRAMPARSKDRVETPSEILSRHRPAFRRANRFGP